jgi:ribonuclease T1
MHQRSWWSSLACTLVASLLAAAPAVARESSVPGAINVYELPREAAETLALIKSGGPFPFRKDGIVFQNRERRLPVKPRGYYTEYTVRTPGRADRGARRIVAGQRIQE